MFITKAENRFTYNNYFSNKILRSFNLNKTNSHTYILLKLFLLLNDRFILNFLPIVKKRINIFLIMKTDTKKERVMFIKDLFFNIIFF